MKEIIFAGLGGQGVLTVGLIVAEIANHRGDNVTWVPSYGSAMRGGTANCTVKYGKEIVYNPAQEECNILLAMHEEALQLFENKVEKGGIIVYNSDLIHKTRFVRSDVRYIGIPCASIAEELGNPKAANVIMSAVILKTTGDFTEEEGIEGMNSMFRKKGKAKFEEQNTKAFKAGYAFNIG